MAQRFENVINFRDVGKTVNEFLGERRLREGIFFRSARLGMYIECCPASSKNKLLIKVDEASPNDKERLVGDFQLKTVIDLRTKSEHALQAKKLQASPAAAHIRSNSSVARPFHMPGLAYHEIKITGGAFERFLLSQLSWWSFFNFIFLFIFGYRAEAIGIIAREVMLPRGLKALGPITLDHSGPLICETLLLYTDPVQLPSVVHCTQGKDRTGLICILLLMILDVPKPAIEHDYFLTDQALECQREKREKEMAAIGLPPDWALTTKEMIDFVETHLDARYGGLNGYLDSIGFGKDERMKVRDTLLY